jgi:hypothetical protein
MAIAHFVVVGTGSNPQPPEASTSTRERRKTKRNRRGIAIIAMLSDTEIGVEVTEKTAV